MFATLKYFMRHLTVEWKAVLALLISVTLAYVLDSIIPLYYKEFTNELSSGSATTDSLTAILVSILTINLIRWVFRKAFDGLMIYIEPKIMAKMMDESYEYLLGHSYDFFSNNFAGSLVKKIGRLNRGFELIFDRIMFGIIPLILQFGTSFIILYNLNTQLAAILGIWSIIFVTINYSITAYRSKFDAKVNEVDSKMGGFIADTISNVLNIQLFAAQQIEAKSHRELTRNWRRLSTTSWVIDAIAGGLFGLMMIGLEIGIFYVGIQLFMKGELTVGDFLLIQLLLGQIFERLWDVGRTLRDIFRGLTDASEMVEIMNMQHEIVDHPQAEEVKITKGEIQIAELTFAYKTGRQVLQDLDLTISGGQKVALVSRSGGGKTTLIRLLLGQYNVPDGRVFIDGIDINFIRKDFLRRSIALVPQDPILFHRSLLDNIRYARPNATLEEVIAAAKKAQCHDFISRLDNGYETLVGERGVKLSGGERQRVAIARAILADAPILILDEATSALDSESEHAIQLALSELMKGRTTIAIAHRLSTIAEMDKIIVMEAGKVMEEGTHSELLTNPESIYAMLWKIQAGGFTADGTPVIGD